MYDDLNYADGRLRHTYIRYNGLPIYIKRVSYWDDDGRQLCLNTVDVKTRKNKTIKINDAGLNYRPMPLGYVNFDGRAYYLMRMPQRRYKQGLDSGSIRVKVHSEDRQGVVPDWNELLAAPLYNVFENGYPSYTEACSLVDRGKTSVAFHRRFAIASGGLGNKYLTYKGNNIGWFENNKILLSKKFKYLKEMLNKEGVRYDIAA